MHPTSGWIGFEPESEGIALIGKPLAANDLDSVVDSPLGRALTATCARNPRHFVGTGGSSHVFSHDRPNQWKKHNGVEPGSKMPRDPHPFSPPVSSPVDVHPLNDDHVAVPSADMLLNSRVDLCLSLVPADVEDRNRCFRLEDSDCDLRSSIDGVD